ncbi:MAG: HSP20 family protein [Verrucomicrobia bacterium]|jgi:HSP20 family protein|nr:MAG: HSP20 family protein [Verrucomicrobiota bacterium]
MNTYHPLRELGIPSRLLTIADALLRDNHGENRNWTPSVNIFEDESGYHVSAELPDVPPSDVKVTVRDGVLTLKGERKLEKKSDTTRYHLVERSYGQFSRSFTLPKDSDGDRVAAEFKNGVLTVSVPKRIEIQPREIEVKVN